MPAKKELVVKNKVVAKPKSAKVVKTEEVEAKVVVPKEVEKKAASKTVSSVSLSVPMYSLLGKEAGNLVLPKEIFGEKVNLGLLSQALRVYQSNKRTLLGHTKTRGEVQGSTRKIYKQKGTGKARHGSIMAPIFVGGGIVFGPRSRKVELELPKKMKKAALISALSQKALESKVFGLDGLDKSTGKTKEIVKGLRAMFVSKEQKNDKKASMSTLVVSGVTTVNALRSVKNIQGVDIFPASEINALEVISHKNLIITKDALVALQERFAKKGEKASSN